MSTLERQAEAARRRMAARLAERGTSAATAAAFAVVPRHRLVPRFWTGRPPAAGARPPSSPWRVEHRVDDDAPDTLELVHELDRALAVNQVAGSPGRATSTASAPRLLAAQADELAVEPGMAVLEIGTGPGYFAAVLAELVGPGGRVVSVDIDAEVATAATERLAACGYGRVVVRTADGDGGAPDLAPFDRVVASVGCTDVAAAWLAQLAPGGRALVPLLHGSGHPQVSVSPDGRGRVVLRSGYVAIQGRQADATPWPFSETAVEATESEPLPESVRAVLAPAAGDDVGRREWDLGFRVALADARAGWLAALDDGDGSSARVDAATGALRWGGPQGAVLARDLRAHVEGWLADGAPAVEDHAHRFVPLAEGAAEGRWRVRRTDHLQVVDLDAR